ncbi:MAG: hypothetical protein QNK04_21545 [Myxococcota bacterium]|nr:hypothetical protein [Myxococcota bacterium]
MRTAVPGPTDVSRAGRDLAALDRRGFLQLAGLVAASGWLPACAEAPPGAAPPDGLALAHLTPRGYAVLNAAAGSLAGPQAAASVRSGALDPARAAERFLAESPDLAGPLGQALLVLEFVFWPLAPKLGPFTSLDDAGREATLRALRDSRLELGRLVFHGVRSISLLAFYGAVSEQSPPGHPIGRIPPGVAVADAVAG